MRAVQAHRNGWGQCWASVWRSWTCAGALCTLALQKAWAVDSNCFEQPSLEAGVPPIAGGWN